MERGCFIMRFHCCHWVGAGFYKDEFGMFVRSLVNWQAHISRVLYVMGLRQVPAKSKTKNAMNSSGG